MSQQIQASTPSPVSQAVAPSAVDQGSTAYPQWVPQAATPVAASVPTAHSPQQVTQATAPTTSNLYSQSPSQSSPSNPWEAAMGSLERVLTQVNSPSPSPTQWSLNQAPQADTATLSQPSQAQPWAYQEPQAAQTLRTSVSPTQTSSQASTAPSQISLSNVSEEVVRHFGIEAPGILNQYSCALEDMLIDQSQRYDALNNQVGAMHTILTNPDHLADYTDRFFTEVYPVDIGDGTGQQGVYQQPQQQYQQQFDMPAVPAGAGGQAGAVAPQQQWEGFSEVMNRNPENAWRYLQGMGQDAMRNKLLFMEGA